MKKKIKNKPKPQPRIYGIHSERTILGPAYKLKAKYLNKRRADIHYK